MIEVEDIKLVIFGMEDGEILTDEQIREQLDQPPREEKKVEEDESE